MANKTFDEESPLTTTFLITPLAATPSNLRYIEMIRQLNPLFAFIAATTISTGWMSTFIFWGESVDAQSVSNLWGHIGFVWVPFICAMCIQAYSSISLKMSVLRASLLSLSSAILAPTISVSILMFVGFVWFGWKM